MVGTSEGVRQRDRRGGDRGGRGDGNERRERDGWGRREGTGREGKWKKGKD